MLVSVVLVDRVVHRPDGDAFLGGNGAHGEPFRAQGADAFMARGGVRQVVRAFLGDGVG